MSLASPTTVGSLTFNSFTGTYTLGTAGQALTVNSGLTMTGLAGTVATVSPVTLSAAQTWTNNSASSLNFQSVATINGTWTLDTAANATFSFDNASAGIVGSGNIVKNGSGMLVLNSAAAPTFSFTGNFVLNDGYIGWQTAPSFTSRNTQITGGYLGGRFNSGVTWAGLGTGANQIQITGGVSGLSGEGGTTSTFQIGTAGSVLKWGAAGENGATGFFNPTVLMANGSFRMNTTGKGSLNNSLDLNGTTRTITSLQTTDGAAGSGFTIGAVINSTGSAGLTKTGIGNLILNAANTYNGATTITSAGLQTNGGGAITLTGSGTMNGTSALNLSGTGTLRLVNTANTQRFADAAAITSNGGFIIYENTSGANVYTETMGSVTLSSGQLNVLQLVNQAGTGSQTLTFGGLAQSGTASVTFSAATTGPQAAGNKNMIVVTGGGTTTTGQIIGPWATTGTAAAAQTDYAVYNSGYVVPANVPASAESTWTDSTQAYTAGLVGTAGTTLGGTRNVAALKLTAATATPTVNTTTDYLTVTGSSFANGDVVSFGGTAPTGTTTGVPYYVINAGGAGVGTFQISTVSGGSVVDMTAAGTPSIVAGIALGSGNNLGATGILNASAAGLTVGKGTGGVVTLPSTTSGNLYLNAGGSNVIIGAPIADNGAGVLTLVKTGSNTVRLIDANTYTGATAINGGTLQLGMNGVSGTAGSLGSGSYSGNIVIAGGATLDIQSSANQTLSGVISGDGNIVKRNTGTLTLSGANTFTGRFSMTPLTATGFTVNVSSFNSVVGGTASSSLGAPTTVANGTIDFGSGSVQTSLTLNYTGSGEITDRVINFQFNGNNVTRTIDTSGSGTLTFTSAPTANATATNGIVLQGSSNGAFTQGLPIAFAGFTKNGTGTWTLGGPVGSTGSFSVSAGTLVATDPRALGTAIGNLATSGPTIGGSGTLSLRNNGSVTYGVGGTGYNINNSASGATLNVGRVSGSGSNVITVGNLTTTSTAATWQLNFNGTGGVSLNAGVLTTPTTASTASHTINNNIAGGGWLTLASVAGGGTGTATRIFDGTGNTAVTGAMTQASAAQALTKNGVGLLTLQGANNYTGPTNVNAGTLLVNGNQSAAIGAVTVANNASLGGSGTVGGATTVQSGGRIFGGSGIDTGLLTTANVTIQNGGKLFANVAAFGTNSTLALGSNLFDLKTGSQVSLIGLAGFSNTAGGSYSLATLNDGGNLQLDGTGVSDAFVFGEYLEGTGNVNSRPMTLDLAAFGQTLNTGDRFVLQRSGNDLGLTFVPVPEPTAMLAVSGGLVALGGLVRRLRRRAAAEIPLAA